ncbi:MAG: hypothetical protein M3063_08420 [Actinomycetota bacterium]|nr:hypothetical protein [Actinomycetota bacterium]
MATAAAPPAYPPGTYGVTVASSTFFDAARDTPARIGQPPRTGRMIHQVTYVPSGPGGPLPTVLFAPGWNNQSAAYDPLLRAVASAGYLVVGVDSPGSSNYFGGGAIFSSNGRDIPNNTIDLSAALDNIEAGPLGSRVDRSAVAAVGHSDGGSVVANLALNSAYQSRRFSAYVPLSGGVPYGLVPVGTFGSSHNGPLLTMIGTRDEYGNYQPGPGGHGTELIYNIAARSRILVTMAGATHLSAYLGSGAQPDDTRAAITNFLNVAEKGDVNARAAFDADVSFDGLSAQEDLAPAWYLSPPARAAGATYTLHATGNGPSTVFGTLTATNPAGTGFITAYGCDDGRPLASNVNFTNGQTVADLAAIHADANGNVCFYTNTATDLIWDQTAETTAITAHNATRLLDTRTPS